MARGVGLDVILVSSQESEPRNFTKGRVQGKPEKVTVSDSKSAQVVRRLPEPEEPFYALCLAPELLACKNLLLNGLPDPLVHKHECNAAKATMAASEAEHALATCGHVMPKDQMALMVQGWRKPEKKSKVAQKETLAKGKAASKLLRASKAAQKETPPKHSAASKPTRCPKPAHKETPARKLATTGQPKCPKARASETPSKGMVAKTPPIGSSAEPAKGERQGIRAAHHKRTRPPLEGWQEKYGHILANLPEECHPQSERHGEHSWTLWSPSGARVEVLARCRAWYVKATGHGEAWHGSPRVRWGTDIEHAWNSLKEKVGW